MELRKHCSLNKSFDYKLPIIKQTYGYNYASNSKLKHLNSQNAKGTLKLKLNSSFSELSITKIYENSMSFIHKKPFHIKRTIYEPNQSFIIKTKAKKKVIDLKQKIPVLSKTPSFIDDKICGWEFN